MKESFGTLSSGEIATLYTITSGRLTAAVTDYGATLVRLLVPDVFGNKADVVLGHDDCTGYEKANGKVHFSKMQRSAKQRCIVSNSVVYAKKEEAHSCFLFFATRRGSKGRPALRASAIPRSGIRNRCGALPHNRWLFLCLKCGQCKVD